MTILEMMLKPSAYLGYFNEMNPDYRSANIFSTFFPNKMIEGLDFSYVKGGKNLKAVLSPSAFDSEAIAVERDKADMERGELPFFKNKMSLGEKDRRRVSELATLAKQGSIAGLEMKMQEIYDDVANLTRRALNTQEYLRSQALTEGKINFNANGSTVEIDYKMEADRKHTIDVTDLLVNPIEALRDVVEFSVEKTGYKPDALMISNKTFLALRNHPLVKEAMKGILISTGAQIVTDSALKTYIKEITGLDIITEDRKVVMPNGTEKRLLAETRGVVMPNTRLGETLIGSSPVAFDALSKGTAIVGTMQELSAEMKKLHEVVITPDGICLYNNQKLDPLLLETFAEMVCLPSFPNSHLIDHVDFTLA